MPKPFTSMTVGERVKWLLAFRPMTQTEAAERMGISQATISNIVGSAARRPSADTLLRMAKVLECDPDFILSGNGSPISECRPASDGEAELLDLFRRVDRTKQDMLLVLARSMAGVATDAPTKPEVATNRTPQRFPCRMTPEGDGFVVTFRDVPEALTQGNTEAEAREAASDALRTAFEFYVEDGRPLPMPSRPLAGEVLISVDH